jgi:hypothetical protein
MNETIILTIAQAILANTKVIQSLVDALPHEIRQEVAKAVAPVAVAPTPAPAPVAAPVAPAPAPVAAANLMPPPPVFAAPVAAPAPVTDAAPFNDGKSMIAYVMSVYKVLGQEKGQGIQKVLDSLGTKNINDVKPEHYNALYQGIEALKA